MIKFKGRTYELSGRVFPMPCPCYFDDLGSADNNSFISYRIYRDTKGNLFASHTPLNSQYPVMRRMTPRGGRA